MANDLPDWLHEIDHTADAGIAVDAATLPELFARAARGLFYLMTDVSAVEPRTAQRITVEARDRQALLVRWLSELNYLHVTRGWLFADVTIETLTTRRLVATGRGEPYDPDRHVLYTEIKAITYHDLAIVRRPDGWHARIIVDV